VNRALPDAKLDNFVDALATRIASFDKWAIANTKRLVNEASCRPTSKSERAGTPAWPPSSDQRRRKESKPSWSKGSSSLETQKIDSDSTWDSSASTASAEIQTAYLTI